jgi:integrase
VQPAATFAYITGWRIDSEVLSLDWRQVDFSAGEVRRDPGKTKNTSSPPFE